MFNDFDETMAFGTKILESGAYFDEPYDHPEALPIHLTTAHNVYDLNDLLERYKKKGHCYNRNSNPNRAALSRLMSTIEGGEASEGFNCGMAAISTAIIANCKAGDHILSDKTGMRNKTAKAREIKVFSGLILCFPLYFRFIKAPAHS